MPPQDPQTVLTDADGNIYGRFYLTDDGEIAVHHEVSGEELVMGADGLSVPAATVDEAVIAGQQSDFHWTFLGAFDETTDIDLSGSYEEYRVRFSHFDPGVSGAVTATVNGSTDPLYQYRDMDGGNYADQTEFRLLESTSGGVIQLPATDLVLGCETAWTGVRFDLTPSHTTRMTAPLWNGNVELQDPSSIELRIGGVQLFEYNVKVYGRNF